MDGLALAQLHLRSRLHQQVPRLGDLAVEGGAGQHQKAQQGFQKVSRLSFKYLCMERYW